MTDSRLLADRLERIKRAVALEEQDRVPVVLEYASFAANVTSTPLPEFLLGVERSVEVMIQAWQMATTRRPADAVDFGRFSPYNLAGLWMSKVAVPGVDLPPDASHQVLEKEILTRADYDRILADGWPEFQRNYLKERIFNDTPTQYLPWKQDPVDVTAKWAEHDVPVMGGPSVAPPFEYLCGGRTLTGFAFDLMQIPEKVVAVMDEIVVHEAEKSCLQSIDQGYPAMWVGGWRTAPAMLSPAMWDRFVWPYLKRLILEVIDHGLIPLLHLDGCWDRELHRFLELPAKKIIVSLDGATDIFRAREILTGHSCLMGDTPPGLLYAGSPDEVLDYSANLVKKLGPRGFILHSGCDIPENAPLENVRAMIEAVY